jgi:hypothetical protein
MKCPKCGTEMQTVQTIARSAFSVRVRQCSSKTCATKFVTEEVPGDPRLYHFEFSADRLHSNISWFNVVDSNTGIYRNI